MKKQARVLKLGIIAAIFAGIAAFPIVMVENATGAAAEDVDRIPFTLPTLKADKMPPVFFSHDLHIAAMEDDCSSCHTVSDEFFLDSEEKSPDEVMAYVHDACVSCHAQMPAGEATGPLLASCRSCHNVDIAAAQAAAN